MIFGRARTIMVGSLCAKGLLQVKIAIGCDHKGFLRKDAVVRHLISAGHEVTDAGTDSAQSVDYPVYGERVGRLVASGECDMGVVLCGTGYGISLAAGRVKGVRAVCCSDVYTARLTRNHNNANVLAMGAMVVGEGLALQILDAFLSEGFLGGRHAERLKMIEAIQPE